MKIITLAFCDMLRSVTEQVKPKGQPGRPKSDRKRDRSLMTRVTDEEREAIRQRAKDAGFATVGHYLREKGLAS